MGQGYLTIQTTTAEEAVPLNNVTVTITDTSGNVLGQGKTDASGNSQMFALEAPPIEYTQTPGYGTDAYATYNVTAEAPGYIPVQVNGVQIVNDESVLPIHMHPLPINQRASDAAETYDIAPINAALPTGPQNQQSAGIPQETRATRLTGPVCLPDYITVHLGTPSDTGAQNVRVPFIDYIKNVVSSEIYSTWNTNAIIANIHVVVSFALNRVYTEWYRSRGYNFDITNNTGYDQKYIHGRNIFKNISDLVDQYFNTYARRTGFANPYFTEYCNGTTATCNGLSQWGTQSLAVQGYTPIRILHYYYPDDLELTQSTCTKGITTSYPGSALTIGSTGADVQRVQNFLNRIRTDYPAIPLITNPNGYYGQDTANAVKTFQQIFHVGFPDGIVGPATWNKITSLYTSIIKLAELGGEGQRIGLSDEPPTTVISQGARGEDVAHLQYILDIISSYYSNIPPVIKDSYFGPTTRNAVIAFQKMAGLTPDGIVGPATWRALYRVYKGIDQSGTEPTVPPSAPGQGGTPVYPGTLLRQGSSGINVKTIQTFLNEIGKTYTSIPPLTVDSSFGPATRAAVIAFQRQFALNPDGIIGPETWNKIMEQYVLVTGSIGTEPTTPPSSPPSYPGTALRQGSRGESVRILQQALGIPADGIFGPQTYNAVINYQRSHGLTPDGIVGPATWNSIFG